MYQNVQSQVRIEIQENKNTYNRQVIYRSEALPSSFLAIANLLNLSN